MLVLVADLDTMPAAAPFTANGIGVGGILLTCGVIVGGDDEQGGSICCTGNDVVGGEGTPGSPVTRYFAECAQLPQNQSPKKTDTAKGLLPQDMKFLCLRCHRTGGFDRCSIDCHQVWETLAMVVLACEVTFR